jgi:hypothetical protein
MKENYEAYFRLSHKEIEIAGPVEYVKEQVASNSASIELFINLLKTSSLTKQLPETGKNLDVLPDTRQENKDYDDFEEVTPIEDVFKRFEDVIAKNGDKIQILVPIPGDSLTQRMVTVVLLYLYFKLKLGIESVSFDELRQVCESHGELDKAHFSAYIKNNKKFFVTDGSGKI